MNNSIPKDLQKLHKDAHEYASSDYTSMTVTPECVYGLIERIAELTAENERLQGILKSHALTT